MFAQLEETSSWDNNLYDAGVRHKNLSNPTF